MKHLVLIFFLFYFFVGKSQGGFRARVYAPSGLNHDTKDVFETSPGNYIAGGIAIEMHNGNYCFLLTLTGLNANGQVQWMKKYGTDSMQFGNHPFTFRMFCKKDNYLYYTGPLIVANEKSFSTLIKFDLNGNIIWQKIYKDTSSSTDLVTQKVSPSVDGGFLLTGFFQDWINNTTPCLLIKTDALGNELWRKKINKAVPNVSDGKAIIQDSASKKIIIVGYQYIGNANYADVYQHLLILDSLGNTISQNHYTPGGFGDIIQTKDGKFVTIGVYRYSGFVSTNNSYATKFDVNNPTHPIWSITTYDPLVVNNAFGSISELPNGDLIIAGGLDTMVSITNRTNVLARIIKVNSITGQVKWRRFYDYSKNDTLDNFQKSISINATSDGGWVTSWSVGNYGNNPLFYVKYDSTGCDTTTAYCLNPVAIKQVNVQNLGLHIYPNPSSGILNVEVNTALEKPLDITLSDALGRIVKQLSLSASTKIDVSDLENGIYFLQVFDEGKLLTTEKIIKN